MTSTETLTIRELLAKAAPFLAERGCSTPRLDAEVLLADTLETDRLHLYLDHDRPLSAEELATYRQRIRRRSRREPVAYILGFKEFRSLPFSVSPDTLIPRPETECVIDLALKLAMTEDPAIIDMGTGSGAIAIALARELEAARLWATDCSPAALDVARANAGQLGVAPRVEFALGDLFAGFDGPFDLIISNPPYIAESERGTLPPDVVDFEPHTALFAGPDGLDVIRRLAAEAPSRLKAGGKLVFEIGAAQAAAVEEIIREQSDLRFLAIAPDLAGLPRVAAAEKSH